MNKDYGCFALEKYGDITQKFYNVKIFNITKISLEHYTATNIIDILGNSYTLTFDFDELILEQILVEKIGLFIDFRDFDDSMSINFDIPIDISYIEAKFTQKQKSITTGEEFIPLYITNLTK